MRKLTTDPKAVSLKPQQGLGYQWTQNAVQGLGSTQKACGWESTSERACV